jgi:uncharacterized protein (DUF433 family)
VTTKPQSSVRGAGPYDTPAYGIAEAARYVKLAAATLRSWTIGRDYPVEQGTAFFQPLIAIAEPEGKLLSFSNLVEAHVLRALRIEHTVPVKAVRTALNYAESQLGVSRLLLSKELRTNARQLFLSEYGRLINLTQSGQYALEAVLVSHLARVEWIADAPRRLFPFVGLQSVPDQKPIVIDPNIAFGRPVVERRGVTTAAIVERIDAGEEVFDLARDYDLSEDEIRAAIVYEYAA